MTKKERLLTKGKRLYMTMNLRMTMKILPMFPVALNLMIQPSKDINQLSPSIGVILPIPSPVSRKRAVVRAAIPWLRALIHTEPHFAPLIAPTYGPGRLRRLTANVTRNVNTKRTYHATI
jgi:hypothetical protein